MEISLRLTQKSNTIKSPHSPLDVYSSNNYNNNFSSNTFRSKSISLINRNTDKFLPNQTTPSNNLSQIIKFINTGKINSTSNTSYNSSSNIIYAKNDLFYTRKKITQKPNSSSNCISFNYTQTNKPVISRKNRYVYSNYNRVFADNKNNKNNVKKNVIDKRDVIMNNIYNLKKNILSNRNKSFIINTSDKYKSLLNPSKDDKYDNFILNKKKKKNCLLSEINMLKTDFQKDIIKQNTRNDLTFGGNNNNNINTKIHTFFTNTRNFGEELKEEDFFNKLGSKTNSDNYNKTYKSKNLLLNNFKY